MLKSQAAAPVTCVGALFLRFEISLELVICELGICRRLVGAMVHPRQTTRTKLQAPDKLPSFNAQITSGGRRDARWSFVFAV
jgi:hypothetical protein